MPSNDESSNDHERGPSRQRQYSHPTSQFPSYLTPATFPADSMVARPLSSNRSESPEDEDDEDETSSQSASAMSVFPQEIAGEGPSPARASSIPHGSLGRPEIGTTSEAVFNTVAHHSYTFPPPTPPTYPPTGTREWREAEETHLTWQPREQRHFMEMRRSGDEGYDIPYELSVPSRVYEHPSSSRSEGFVSSSHYEDDQPLAGPSTQRGYEEAHLLRPPPHYPDSHYGRPRRTTLQEGGRSQSTSLGMIAPGTLQDSGPSGSRVVLPPVSQLLGMLGHDNYEQGPVLPRLRLPEAEESALGGDVLEHAGESTRGKKRRTEDSRGVETEERKTKVAQKIYVACDFCRGRKLRCDGTKPRCSNCATRSLACRYQDHPRRRGPGKAPKGSKKTGGKGRTAKKDGSESASAGPSTGADPGDGDRQAPHMEMQMAWTPPPYGERGGWEGGDAGSQGGDVHGAGEAGGEYGWGGDAEDVRMGGWRGRAGDGGG
ncbi:hypothetical protein F5I97DRAFT_1928628 [Phlebopus sp. FC_14]|nr:hypothetical protein F5I97DRAFT_1928628 [Phlebopus sp. FC_14]